MLKVARLDAWEASVTHCLAKRKIGGGHYQNEEADTYGRILDTVASQLNDNSKELMKPWAREDVTIEEDELSTE